ncbi:MAG: insulinase family protein, partial [Nitrospirota bacterium]
MLKRMLRLAIVLAIITVLPAPHPAMANSMKVQEFTLNNGLKVLLVEESKAPVITVQIWYKVGSRHEV